MLPFLKPRKQDSGISTVMRAPDEDKSKMSQDDYSGLEAAMMDFAEALDRKDYKAMAEASKAAFEICDAMPHHEGPHLDEDSD